MVRRDLQSGALPAPAASRGEAFRPHFIIDARLRVKAWPGVAAQGLGMTPDTVIGRPCWTVMAAAGTAADCTSCPLRSAGRTEPASSRHCARLPVNARAAGWIAWMPLGAHVTGPPGSALNEGLVLAGVLGPWLARSAPQLLDALRQACGADDCELFVRHDDGALVSLVDCVGVDREAFFEITEMPLGVGYPGIVVQTRRPLFTHRFSGDGRFRREAVKRRGIQSFIGVPLPGADGGARGYLGMAWRDPQIPRAWAQRVLAMVTPLVAAAVTPHKASTATVPVTARLALRCLGGFEIRRGGERLTTAAFARRKSVELLQHLLLARGAPVARDVLVERLWPEVDPLAGANRLHGVVKTLRDAIERHAAGRHGFRVVQRDRAYAIECGEGVEVDLYRFLDQIDSARRSRRRQDTAQAMAALGEAISGYGGALFGAVTEPDAFEMERTRLRHLYLDAVRERAGLLIARGQRAEAIATLRAALCHEPTAIDLHETLIRQLIELHRFGEAREQFRCCSEVLWRELSMAPPRGLLALCALLQ